MFAGGLGGDGRPGTESDPGSFRSGSEAVVSPYTVVNELVSSGYPAKRGAAATKCSLQFFREQIDELAGDALSCRFVG
jgi:hypothetical protein